MDLRKRYGGRDGVRDVSFTVARGEVFGYLGPNGAGKSTTIKLLTTLLRPSSGHARVEGLDTVADALELRRIIGYLPERVPIYPGLSAREYLAIFARLHGLHGAARRERVDRLLALVKLEATAKKPLRTYSKGMVQRVGLARALLNEPRVLFLDEPASGLDPSGRRELRALIRRLAKNGVTVFLSTHDLGEAQLVCDRVAFLRAGALVNVQSVRELAAAEPRTLEVGLDRASTAVVVAVERLPGVRAVRLERDRLFVSFTPPATEAGVLRAVQHAGALVVRVRADSLSVEDLYARHVEEGSAGGETP